jgi:hypothetical protein
VSANPVWGGTVTGADIYPYGSEATITVNPNYNFLFDYWTKDGIVVSDEPSYTFIVRDDGHFVAHFSFYDAVKENSTSELLVYPNPAKDKLNLQGVNMNAVKVCNTMGQVVIAKECGDIDNIELDLSVLKSGIYTISVHTVEGTLINGVFVKQ